MPPFSGGSPRFGSTDGLCFPFCNESRDEVIESMSLLGKILVVANLLFTLLLMAFSLSVYATHRNWHEEATSVSKKLQLVKAENEASETRYRRLDSQLKLEIEASLQEVRKLETERETLLTESAAPQSNHSSTSFAKKNAATPRLLLPHKSTTKS